MAKPPRRAGRCLLGLLALGLGPWAGALGAPAAPGGPDEAEQAREYVRMATELSREMGEARRLIARLDAVAARYADARGLAAAAPERAALREDLEARAGRIEDLHARFDALVNLMQIRRGAAVVLEAFRGKQAPAADRDLAIARRQRRFEDAAHAFKRELRQRIERDAREFAEAEHRVASRRLSWVLSAAGAVLLCAVLALALRRGRASDAEAADTRPALRSAAARITARRRPVRDGGEGPVLGGAFRVTSPLGRGGTAYEALDLATSRPVVVKRVCPGAHWTEEGCRRFLEEVGRVEGLRHPNIVPLLSAFADSGALFIVSERAGGQSLGRRLDAGGRLSAAQARGVLEAAAAAVGHAHAHGVVHGDLSPANLMVAPDGDLRVKDFAAPLLARRVLGLTWADAGVGPAYMAPEQELGEAVPPSDVFSLAVLFYELAAGRLPFEGPGFLDQKREGRYVPLSRVAEGLPPRTDSVLARALDPDPRRRLQTPADLCSAFL